MHVPDPCAPLSPTDWRFTYDGVSISLLSLDRQLEFRMPLALLNRRGHVMWRINGRDDMAAAGRARDRFAKTSYYAGQQSINWPPGGRGLKDRLLELARESVARVILGVLGNRRCCRVTRSWRGVRRPHVLAHEHRAHFGLS